MIVDRPEWIHHDADAPIFSLDVDPSGRRLATAGSDSKVRIWNLRFHSDPASEEDASVPKLLATLGEHCAAVNVVRFSPDGRFLASGSDARVVLVHELRAGPGTKIFGSKDAPSEENWKVKFSLTGHGNNVVDLCWAPSSGLLASASVDNMVIIWDSSTGGLVRKLEGHQGFVKGVAWDPFNKYLASEGDDAIIIWRVEDWTQVTRIIEPPMQNFNLTYHSRPHWSHDGQILAIANAYLKPSHVSAMVARNTWKASNNLVGHQDAVVVARFNSHYFHSRQQADGHHEAEEDACHVVAVGSADHSASVWHVGQPEPICVLQLFDKDVLDLCWSPDGYTLMASSFAGEVIMCRFDESELGRRVSEEATKDLYRQLHGDPRLRGGTVELAESALQLQLESESNLAVGASAAHENGYANGGTHLPNGTVGPSGVAAPARQQQQQQQQIDRLQNRLQPAAGQPSRLGPANASQTAAPRATAAVAAAAAGSATPAVAALHPANGPGAGRLASGTVGGTSGSGTAPLAPAAGPPLHRPPTTAAPTAPAAAAAGHRPQTPAVFPAAPPAAAAAGHRTQTAGAAAAAAAGPLHAPPPQQRAAPPASSSQHPPPGPGASSQPQASSSSALPQLLPPRPISRLESTSLNHHRPVSCSGSSAAAYGSGGGGGGGGGGGRLFDPSHAASFHRTFSDGDTVFGLVMVEADNGGRDHRGQAAALVVCRCGTEQLWSDTVAGQVACIAGSRHFSAVSTTRGDVLVYSPAGRRILPPIHLGCTAAFMSTDADLPLNATAGRALERSPRHGWRLVVVTTDGAVRVWDLRVQKELLTTTLAPLLSPVRHAVAVVRLSEHGAPIVVLDNRTAFSYQQDMGVWLRLADASSFPASAHHSTMSGAGASRSERPVAGDLHQLQVEAANQRSTVDVLSTALHQHSTHAAGGERAHLETNMAAALALGSAQEWRQWLLSYVQHLTTAGDHGRLREVLEDLLGPLRWSHTTHPDNDPHGWQPTVLGLDKRKLLRGEVMRVVRARGNQKLVEEFMSQLKAIDVAQARAAARPHAAQPNTQPVPFAELLPPPLPPVSAAAPNVAAPAQSAGAASAPPPPPAAATSWVVPAAAAAAVPAAIPLAIPAAAAAVAVESPAVPPAGPSTSAALSAGDEQAAGAPPPPAEPSASGSHSAAPEVPVPQPAVPPEVHAAPAPQGVSPPTGRTHGPPSTQADGADHMQVG